MSNVRVSVSPAVKYLPVYDHLDDYGVEAPEPQTWTFPKYAAAERLLKKVRDQIRSGERPASLVEVAWQNERFLQVYDVEVLVVYYRNDRGALCWDVFSPDNPEGEPQGHGVELN